MYATVADNGRVNLDLPEYSGQRVEITILSADGKGSELGQEPVNMQKLSGFMQTVLADPDEDVWNEL